MRMKYKHNGKDFYPYGAVKLDGGISKNKKRKRKKQRLARRLNRKK